MKVNRFGRASILTPSQINLLFDEGFTKPRDRALFGVCLYAATRINEACTLLRGDVIGIKGVREVLVIRIQLNLIILLLDKLKLFVTIPQLE